MFNPDSLKRYFANTSWLVLERVLRMGVGLILSIYIARYLEPARFGILSYTQSFAGLFMLLATMGLDSIVIRNLVNRTNQHDRLIGTAFVIKMFGALLVLLILAAIVPFTDHDFTTNLMIFSIASSGLLQAFNVIDFHFQAQVQSRYVVFAQIAATAVTLLFTLSLVWLHASLLWFALIMPVSHIVSTAGLVGFYQKQQHSLHAWQFDSGLAKQLLQEAWPLILSVAIVSVYFQVDRIMIQIMLGDVATGEYSAAAKLSEGWYFIPNVIVASVFPAIVSARQRDAAHYYKRLQNLYDLMVWMAIIIAIPVTVLSERIIVLLYGESYAAASIVLTIHIWAGIFVFTGVASGRWMIVEGYSRPYFYRLLAGTLLNVALNYLLLPVYGISGAALATLIAQFCIVIVFDALIPETRISFQMKCRAFLPLHWWQRTR